MRYLLMMHTPPGDYDHGTWAPDDWKAHLDYWRELNAALKASGEFVGVHALTAPSQAHVVRANADGAPTTDGVFPESKEFLAGFWVVEVDGPARANEIAARASAAPGPGGAPLRMPIEVREVMQSPT